MTAIQVTLDLSLSLLRSSGDIYKPACQVKTASRGSNSDKVQTKQSPVPSTSTASSCRDAQAHTQHKNQMGFVERLKSIYRNAVSSKESCIACTKKVQSTKLVIAPCQHRYCHHCLRKMGHIGLENKERFPVRCCNQEIPAKRVAMTLDAEKKKLYVSRRDEDAVSPAERWYCPHTKCGRWIPQRHLKARAKTQKCCHCRATICSRCRDLAHDDRECSQDPGLEQVLEVARNHHWQRCYSCHAIVSKHAGCNHMKCTCGAEFCYTCGGPFEGCNCILRAEIFNQPNQAEEDEDVAVTIAAMELAERQEAEIQRRGRRPNPPRHGPATPTWEYTQGLWPDDFDDSEILITAREIPARGAGSQLAQRQNASRPARLARRAESLQSTRPDRYIAPATSATHAAAARRLRERREERLRTITERSERPVRAPRSVNPRLLLLQTLMLQLLQDHQQWLVHQYRFQDERFQDGRFQDGRFQDERFQDERFQDGRFHQFQFNQSRFHQSRFRQSRFRQSRFQQSWFQQSRFQQYQFQQYRFRQWIIQQGLCNSTLAAILALDGDRFWGSPAERGWLLGIGHDTHRRL